METPTMPQSPLVDPEAAADGSPATTGDGKLKRKRQARNTACQACANQKMKCVAQPDGSLPCERCTRQGRDCVPALRKVDKRRTLDGAQPDSTPVQAVARPSLGTAVPSPRANPPSTSKKLSHQADTSSLLLRHDLSYKDSKSFILLFSRGLGNVYGLSNAAVCESLLHGVDYNFVANCFTIFRQLTPYFPFAELSPAADVVTMVARRPALTLAVCAVASASWPNIQDRLSQVFLHALSSKMIHNSESSLDLLTGLLVYLAWHHHYLPQQQTYQKLCLLAGMASDLGLYRPTLSSMDDPGSTLERDRAFVGCYYLCSSLSATGYNRPNPLRWTDNFRQAAENASRMGTLPTDRELVSILELTRAMDDLEDGLQEHSGVLHIDLHTKAALHRLKALKREHPSLASSLRYAAANLHVYQRLLRSSAVSDPAILIQCACAVKEYTDDILARPASTLHQTAIVDWTNLLEILLLMAKVSKPSTGGWEAGALASMLQPEVVLDSLYSHMASTPSNDPLSSRHEGLLQRFRNVCEGIKSRFLVDSGPAGVVTAQEDELSFDAGAQPNLNGEIQSLEFDAYSYFGNGVLDPHFWSSLTGVAEERRIRH